MHDRHAPWAALAWQHWHRPWAVTHSSWLHEARPAVAPDGRHELALRLHYAAWCSRYTLEPELTGFDDSTWWRLFGLPPVPFERVAERVGLTLMFATNRRQRLLRRDAAVDVALVRWALERAHFVPESVVAAVGELDPPAAASRHGTRSLRWCLPDEAPSLWTRMRLRFRREHVQADDDRPPRPVDPTVRTQLIRLWAAATRFEQSHLAQDDGRQEPQEDKLP